MSENLLAPITEHRNWQPADVFDEFRRHRERELSFYNRDAHALHEQIWEMAQREAAGQSTPDQRAAARWREFSTGKERELKRRHLKEVDRLIKAGDFSNKEAYLAGKAKNAFGPIMNAGMGGLVAFGTYKSLTEETETWKPNFAEKAGAAMAGARDLAMGLLLPWYLDLGIGLAIGGSIGYKMFKDVRRQGFQVEKRNWHKPNLAPIFSEGGLSATRQGLNQITNSGGMIGNEARVMAMRRY